MEADWLSHADENDPATWPTKKDLRERLGINNRTIERWAAKPDKLRTQQRKPPGHKSIPVYHPGDVRKLWGQTMPLQPNSDTTTATLEERHVTTRQAATPDAARALTTILGEGQGGLLRDALLSLSRLSLAAKTFLTAPEAALLLGISEARLKALANQGAIPAIKGKGKSGRWTFCRADLLACNLSTLSHLPHLSPVTPTHNDTTQGDRQNGEHHDQFIHQQ